MTDNVQINHCDNIIIVAISVLGRLVGLCLTVSYPRIAKQRACRHNTYMLKRNALVTLEMPIYGGPQGMCCNMYTQVHHCIIILHGLKLDPKI